MFERQNDKTSLIYQRAVYFCFKREKITSYFMILFSVLLSLLSIVNKYLHILIPIVEKNSDLSSNIAKMLIVSSGVWGVFSIFLGRFCDRMRKEGANILERCDCYVFGLEQNRCMMRPIPETVIEDYASRVRKSDAFFKNAYFSRADNIKSDALKTQLDYQKKQFEDEYRLMLYIHPFYMVAWIVFGLLIFAMAVTTETLFLETLANIFIPSLSAISMIFNASHNYNESVRCISNCLNTIRDLEKKPPTYSILRNVQDGLFRYRLSSFIIPNFMIKRHRRILERETWGYDTTTDKPISDVHIRRLPSGETRSYDLRTTPLPPVSTQITLKGKKNEPNNAEIKALLDQVEINPAQKKTTAKKSNAAKNNAAKNNAAKNNAAKNNADKKK